MCPQKTINIPLSYGMKCISNLGSFWRCDRRTDVTIAKAALCNQRGAAEIWWWPERAMRHACS